MKKADGSGASVAVVIEEDEAKKTGEVGLKPLRGPGAQQRVALAALTEAMAGLLYGDDDEGLSDGGV